MPCRDYMDDVPSVNNGLKERADMLSRVACKSLDLIEEIDPAALSALLLRDPEIHRWYTAHKEADRKEAARLAHAEQQRLAGIRKSELAAQAKAKLTPEEIKALGLK